MKNLFLAVLSGLLLSCSTDSQTAQESQTQRTENIVRPVYNANGLWNKTRNRYFVNIQWYTDYDFPTYQPYYNTITLNGVVVADNYYEPFNRFSIEVDRYWQSGMFTITQTVVGVGTSEAVTLNVMR